MTPSTPLFTVPTFDDTNSAVVWKAVDFSMVRHLLNERIPLAKFRNQFAST